MLGRRSACREQNSWPKTLRRSEVIVYVAQKCPQNVRVFQVGTFLALISSLAYLW